MDPNQLQYLPLNPPREIQDVKDVVRELKFISFNLNVDIRAYAGISMGYLGSEEKIWKI